MSNFDVSYCVEADLRTILPNIADYDKKRVVSGWSSDSALVDRYKAGSTGTIDVLYKDGFELGTAEASLAAVTADDEWFYDSAADAVYYFNDGDDPNGLNMESGTDWATLVASAISKSSEITRAIVGKSIYRHRFGSRDYDEVIVSSAAAIAVGRLVRPHDEDLSNRLERYYNNDFDEFPKGMLQKVRDGQISLSNEITPDLGSGVLVENALDSTTTGGIDDIRGSAVENDTLEISIVTGGTFSYGSDSTVTYQVKGKTSVGLMTATLVSATIINGDYQTLANNMQLRFVPGVYVANDSWYVKISREEVETHEAVHSVIATSAW